MGVTVTNLTEGPATLYTAPVGSTEPLDTALATAPASPWVDMGGTQDGVMFRVAKTYKELEVDQIVDSPGRRITKRDASFKTNLAEPTLLNLTASLNEAAPTSGTGTLSYEPDVTDSSVQPGYKAFLLDCIAPGGFRRRITIRRGLSIDDVEMAYKKDGQTLVPVTFAAHYVSGSIKPYKVLDATA